MPQAYSFDNTWERARARLKGLEARFDPGTVSHLEMLGVGDGWRCLELGAGAGSVAHWLGERVGRAGVVIAVDLDTSLMEATEAVEVRQLDVVAADLPEGDFDFVHARALLAHLPERDRVLAKMVRALRPGGWVLCEERDNLTAGLVAPEDPAAESLYAKVEDAVAREMAARGHAYDYGRRLPARLAAAGVVDVGAEGRMLLRRTGADATVARLTVEQLRDQLLDAGAVSTTDIDAYFALLDDPRFLARSATMIAAWGRRPA